MLEDLWYVLYQMSDFIILVNWLIYHAGFTMLENIPGLILEIYTFNHEKKNYVCCKCTTFPRENILF